MNTFPRSSTKSCSPLNFLSIASSPRLKNRKVRTSANTGYEACRNANRQGREKWRNPKEKKKRGSNPFSLASSILDRNATECFATRNVAGAGTASGFSRVLDPWKTAIKRFISTPLLRVQPSFLPPSNVSSFFPRRWDTRVWCLPSVLTSSHLSLSLSFYR